MPDLDGVDALLDLPVVAVPAGGPARALQARMARFTDGPGHARRREQVVAVLRNVDVDALRGSALRLSRERLAGRTGPVDVMGLLARRVPVVALAAALGVDSPVLPDVRVFAAYLAGVDAYRQEADQAASRLSRLGVPVASVLFQAHDATAALVAGALVPGRPVSEHGTADLAHLGPPVATTDRTGPDGGAVAVPLAGRPFGSGRHACPGAAHAVALADAVLDALRERAFTACPGDPPLEPRTIMRLPAVLMGVLP